MIADLEEELRKWRASRSAKPERDTPGGRRTVKVNGQDVLVVRRRPKARAASGGL
jgi:hypothetical protein